MKTLISNILKTKFELYFQREGEEEIFVHFSATIKILLHHLYFSLGLPTPQLKSKDKLQQIVKFKIGQIQNQSKERSLNLPTPKFKSY